MNRNLLIMIERKIPGSPAVKLPWFVRLKIAFSIFNRIKTRGCTVKIRFFFLNLTVGRFQKVWLKSQK